MTSGLLRKWEIQAIQTFKSVVALFTSKFFFKKEERDYYMSYSNEKVKNPLGSCMIAMFDGRQIHCGLTDRFKGIATTFEFSKEFGLPFYLYYKSPFDIIDYMIPNQYDWRVKDEDVLYNKNTSVPIFLNNWQSNTSFHKKYLEQVLKNNPGKQIHVYGDSPYYINRYVDDFYYLFKTSKYLQDAIDKCLAEIGDKDYTAMSFRFLMLLGDFKEEHSIYPVLEPEEQEQLIKRCEEQVLKLRKERNISGRILITADSKRFVDYMSDKYDFVYVVPGDIAHIDNTHNSDKSIYLKTFLDMFMLSKAQAVYQLCTGEMYKNSAFARQAAKIGNKEYIKIEF